MNKKNEKNPCLSAFENPRNPRSIVIRVYPRLKIRGIRVPSESALENLQNPRSIVIHD